MKQARLPPHLPTSILTWFHRLGAEAGTSRSQFLIYPGSGLRRLSGARPQSALHMLGCHELPPWSGCGKLPVRPTPFSVLITGA